MKFIVKAIISGDVEWYLEVGHGSTPNRSEAAIFDSEVVSKNKRINFKSWLSKHNTRVIPVGDLKAYEHI